MRGADIHSLVFFSFVNSKKLKYTLVKRGSSSHHSLPSQATPLVAAFGQDPHSEEKTVHEMIRQNLYFH